MDAFNFFNLPRFNSGPLLMGQPYKSDVPDFDPKINRSLVMRLDPWTHFSTKWSLNRNSDFITVT